MEASSNSLLVHQAAHRTTSAPSAAEMISKSVIGSCSNEPATVDEDHRRSINPFNHSDDGGNQSDSSNSTSSLASSPRYNERHPRAFESLRKSSGSGRIYSGGNSGGNSSSSARSSFVVLGSRTSLPPLDENCTLDATESQLSLQLRRATRSSSWTNQKILDAIDGLNTSIEELDPCLVIGGKVSTSAGCTAVTESSSKTESSRQSSFEKFVLPKSISNLIMKSRSSGSVNPPTSAQNRENSCYNFLSGIREDEDEEQHQDDMSGGPLVTGIQLTITPSAAEEKRRNFIAKGVESVKNCEGLVAFTPHEKNGKPIERYSKNGNVAKNDDSTKKKVLTRVEEQHQPQDKIFSRKIIPPCSTSHQQADSFAATDDVVKGHPQLHRQPHQNSKNVVQSQSESHCSNSSSIVIDKTNKNERPRSAENLEQEKN